MLVKMGPLDRRKRLKRKNKPLPVKNHPIQKIYRDPPNRLAYGESSFYALLAGYKKSAANRSMEFTLSDEQFLQLTVCDCHYCGVEPSQKFKTSTGFGPYIYNGIDRIDNNIGYVIENCVSCCKKCNFLKRSSTSSEFIEHCHRVSDFQRQNLTIDNQDEMWQYNETEQSAN